MTKEKKFDRVIKLKAYELIDLIKKRKYFSGFEGNMNRTRIIDKLTELGFTPNEITQCL